MKYFNYLDSIKDHEVPDYDQLVQLFAGELRDYDLTYEDFDITPNNNEIEGQTDNEMSESLESNESESETTNDDFNTEHE